MNYYNENDPFAADWLVNLSDANEISKGIIDDRSIRDVQPDALRKFKQCHFFAGIGIWSHALRRAGWDDDRSIWTGSCPCQPWSSAGNGAGEEDERDLWPVWFPLIEECRPDVIVGEQVASPAGLRWLDRLYSDLESAGYAVGAVDLCAAGVDSWGRRQRIYWMAYADRNGRNGVELLQKQNTSGRSENLPQAPGRSQAHGLANSDGRARLEGGAERTGCDQRSDALEGSGSIGDGFFDRLGNPYGSRLQGHSGHEDAAEGRPQPNGSSTAPGVRDREWVQCADGKFRPIEPGVQPLAYAYPSKLGRPRAILEGMGYRPADIKRILRRPRTLLSLAGKYRSGVLRGYGNAIDAELATEFVKAVMEILPEVIA